MPFSAENDSYQIDTGWTPVMPNIYEVFKVNNPPRKNERTLKKSIRQKNTILCGK